MLRFLFWNVCGVASPAERSKEKVRPLSPSDGRQVRIRRALTILAGRQDLDVIVLAESPFEGQIGIDGFTEARTSLAPNRATRTRLEIYHRPTVSFTGFEVSERVVIHELQMTASGERLLLVSAHLDSALNPSVEDRARKVEQLAADIRDKEKRVGHERTILVGDLNYDPHDTPITSAYGLNAVASKAVASQGTRRVLRNSFPFFYNPMWAHMTDATDTPPGTYYRKTSSSDCRFWYTPDQVLVRPALLESWDDTTLQILTGTGKIKLLDNSDRPDRVRFSDHLPLVFRLRLG